MRAFTIGLLAVAGIAIAVPAHAEDAYIGVGPVGVGVGDHDRDRDRDWRHHYARDRHCRVTIVHEDGMTKKIKRCRLSAVVYHRTASVEEAPWRARGASFIIRMLIQ